MLTIHWTEHRGWENSKILSFYPLQVSPGAQVLHFANIVFEDVKPMKGVDGKIRKFRPRDNPSSLNSFALRPSLPISLKVYSEYFCSMTFSEQELLKCIKKILQIDSQCVPTDFRKSVYIRSAIMSTEVSLELVR